MFNGRIWISGIAVILGLVLLMPAAEAQRQEFELTHCSVATINSVHISPELAITSWDINGITQNPHGNKLFDNWTRHLVMVYKRIDRAISWSGFSKTMAPDGEFIIWELSGDSQQDGSFAKAIYGTGKWKGVKGEYKTKRIAGGKRIVSNIEPYCEKGIGWIELPK